MESNGEKGKKPNAKAASATTTITTTRQHKNRRKIKTLTEMKIAHMCACLFCGDAVVARAPKC